MKITELEILLANTEGLDDIEQFTVKPDVEVLPEGENGDIRMTTTDSHIHLFHDGWKDLGAFEDERMEQVDQLIEDVQDLDMGNYIKKENLKKLSAA